MSGRSCSSVCGNLDQRRRQRPRYRYFVADNVEAFAKGSPIFAWSGDDTLTASIGSDTLVFANQIGNDVVHNFDTVHDKIDLIGFAGFASFADVQAHLTSDGSGNAVITLADGETITLNGVAASSLNAGDFQFSHPDAGDLQRRRHGD